MKARVGNERERERVTCLEFPEFVAIFTTPRATTTQSESERDETLFWCPNDKNVERTFALGNARPVTMR